MRLALIIDDYLPHSTRVGAKMFHELAVCLAQKGHNITVITPVVGLNTTFTESSLDNITIWNFRSGPIKDVGKFKRVMNESLLSFKAWRTLKHKITKNTFDGIIYYSPSIFFGDLVARIKHCCDCPTYLILRDLFPQWVIDAGMIRKGSLIEKYFRFFERKTYNQANTIGLMSDKNLDIFNRMTSNQYSCEVLQNWAALQPHKIKDARISIRKKFKLEDKIIFFYGGNIGHAQDMTNLMRLAKNMQPYPQAHFLFIGQGDEVELINKIALKWEMSNFTYLPSVDQLEFKNILSEIDIGLFSLSPTHTTHNFPGKLLGYMVQSIPILGSVNVGNDLIPIIETYSAGLVTVNGDDENLLKNAILLYESKSLRKNFGIGAFRLLQEKFSVESIASQIQYTLQS